jgi:hypothetical protein
VNRVQIVPREIRTGEPPLLALEANRNPKYLAENFPSTRYNRNREINWPGRRSQPGRRLLGKVRESGKINDWLNNSFAFCDVDYLVYFL